MSLTTVEEAPKIRVLSVFGTRPEAAKMCPLVLELQNHPRFESMVCVTAQHREMLDQVLHIFGVVPDYDLDIMKPNQTLSGITTRILEKIEPVLRESKPDLVLVHGDTTTSFAVALAAFYQQIPVGHVEAGLRTYNMYSPFPEEMNRVLTGRLATLHFAPTSLNRANLVRENILEKIFITGNTVLDAFKTTVRENYSFKNTILQKLDLNKGRYILMTAHRRENIGPPLEAICHAVLRLVKEFDDIKILYPVHPNPAIHDPVHKMLGHQARIYLLDPLELTDLHNLMAKCHLVLTDSGGLQEEGPSFKKPVLVLRTETERPEAVEAGCVKVIGVKEDAIVEEVRAVLTQEETYQSFLKNPNPYGDGSASRKIINAILGWKEPLI